MLNYVTSSSPADLAKKNQYPTQTTALNYEYAPEWMFGNSAAGDIGDDVQLNSSLTYTDNSAAAVSETKGNLLSGCDDGSNDGKIGIGSIVANTLWGAVKAVGNTVKDIVTDPKKAIAAVATTAICIAFPPAGVVVGAIGVASGLKGCYNAWQNAHNATTDDEAKAACQDFGASGLQVGLSVMAARGSFKAMKATHGSALAELAAKGKSPGLKGIGETAKAFAKDTVTGGRGFKEGTLKINTANAGYKGTQVWGTVKGKVSSGFENVKTNGFHPVQSVVKGAQNVRTAAGNTIQNTVKNGIHPLRAIRSGAGRFSAAATSAGYKSAFGSLTAPIAHEITNTNGTYSNYNEAVYRSMTLGGGGVNGNYNFSNDWMNMTPDISGNYTYNTNYEELAGYAGYNARQLIDC